MGSVLVLGGGICGVATATMLARDGHDVTVVEKDAYEPPATIDEAVEAWERPGVAQFRQVHYMHARFRHVLDAELPDVLDALVAGGGRRYDPVVEFFPPFITDRSPREGDDRFQTVTGRRPMLETVFATTAANEPGVKILRGVKVESLITGPEAIDGVPNVVGVRTSTGEEMRADLVIDSMGRGSKLTEWLKALGARPPYEESEDCGFTYYARFFRGDLPQQIGPPLAEYGSYSTLGMPADNGTWWVVIFMASGDRALKNLRHVDKWSAVMRSMPLKAHWIDGEPITDILPMSGISDRYRRFVIDGRPVVTGLLPVADAWACTNPSRGRGISLGLWHAQLLRGLVRGMNGDPGTAALEWDHLTEQHVAPWYWAQVSMDRQRSKVMDADREGRELPQPAPDDVGAQMAKAFLTAIPFDADVFRAFMEVMGCLATPQEIFARPGMVDKVLGAADGKEELKPPGPTRQELLELLA